MAINDWVDVKITSPMLAHTLEDPAKLKYPVLCTPKLDGIRALKLTTGLVTRKFKPVPNQYIQEMCKDLPMELDGELMIGSDTGDFNAAQSGIMSEDGRPDFIYNVFDYVKDSLDTPYTERMEQLKALPLPKFCHKILPVVIKSPQELLEYENRCLDKGYEGIMVRVPSSPYETKRSKQLLKYKRFKDSEAYIVGFEEKMHNENTQGADAFGYAKRSSAKAGLVPAGTLGALTVKDIHTDVIFGIGSGFDDKIRREIWDNREKYLGKVVKYKYFEIAKDKPRFPVFIGFRDPRDI